VLLANNIRDISYDTRQGIHTIAIRLGEQRSLTLYAGLIATAFLAVVIFVLAGLVTPWALLVLLAAPKAIALLKMFKKQVPEAADAITAQLNTIFGLLLIAGLILGRVLPL
jgi:1,4-dihydroxy-2-naphthoate polyprenyltransferase